ncbi:NAD-dependent epimerase/dehydratase family protein [Vibrio tubiashii]|uniref:NAD-dependent epimerase/dehydratase family protein n=1 Tax=Vibrio tubiashii TaxID=29498 RepID=UPI00349ED9FE
MCNVLVTGSKGFLGSTLVKALHKHRHLDIYEVTRATTDEELINYLSKVEIIFHLAGEVRPKSSNSEFELSNVALTENICEILESKGRNVPIVFASTVHAINPVNTYGETKRKAELRLENYSLRNSSSVWIYRLPHMFGPNCKPNYNSVISTWMNAIANNEEIVVFDSSTPMTYAYSIDTIKDFESHLGEVSTELVQYLSPTQTYNVTLGEVVNILKGFVGKREDDIDSDFEQKLFDTFQAYI